MAKNDSAVMAANGANCGALVSMVATCGCCIARASRSNGPLNITKVTKMPTAVKVRSLTIDSAAIASISPS